MADVNCPNCGAAQHMRFAAAKMATCAYCDTTLYIDGTHLRDAGSSGEMHDAPLLFQVGHSAVTSTETFLVLGHARFDYGRGWWDEFFATTSDGDAVWISVDEGDVIVQRPIASDQSPDITSRPALGAELSILGEIFRVIEEGTSTCVAVRGEFPEILYVGSKYSYVNCQDDADRLVSGEFSTGAPDWYLGRWLDPFELTGGSGA